MDANVKQRILEELTVKCGDCNSPLIIITITENNESRAKKGLKPMITKFQATCAKCNSHSFETKVFCGTTCVQPGSPKIEVGDMDCEVLDNGVVFTKVNTKLI